MLGNRALNLDDYTAMLRRRRWIILIPALLAPLVGFLISFALTPTYQSQSLVLVESQQVPEGYVKPVITQDLTQRIATMQQQVLSRNRLQPVVERLGLARGTQGVDAAIEGIRTNLVIKPVQSIAVASPSSSGLSSPAKKKKTANASANSSDLPGFYVQFTAKAPAQAQQVCAALTSMLLEENLKAREDLAQGTTDFLSRQLQEAKQNLDDLDSKMATFKRQYLGQLPGDEDTNLKLLMTLNTQLDASTQTLGRARQDKTYAESVLAQQVAAWKLSQSATNPQTLEQQIAALQSQLITLENRYTDAHPDVIKTKNDIAELKRKLDEANATVAQTSDTTTPGAGSEPVEVRQLRMQLRQYDAVIAQATADQKRLQSQINMYQGRVALSPSVEEQYKGLNRDYNTAQGAYNDLLAKKGQSEMQIDMERHQQGEQMRLLNPASLPDSPSSPVRWMFAAGGLGAGLALGFALALWLEFRDSSIRNERDLLAAMDLPMLGSLPWVGADTDKRNSSRWWNRLWPFGHREAVEV
jgi:polysaccharide chain length determinant protein (PEP-CTERM system associated)